MLKMKAKKTVFSESKGGIYCAGRHVPQSQPKNVYIQKQARHDGRYVLSKSGNLGGVAIIPSKCCWSYNSPI